MVFDKKSFYKYVVDNEVIGFFREPVTLKSGRVSNWYVNWRNPAEDVFLIDKLSDYVIDFAMSIKDSVPPDCFYGVPEGATKLGVITQFKWGKKHFWDYEAGKHVLAMGRGMVKEHGAAKDKYFLGVPKGRTIILEDVTTTGDSLLSSIKALKNAEINVVAAIGLTNRNELRDHGKTVEEIIMEEGSPYYAMSNALELLPMVIKAKKPDNNIILQCVEYFKKYGTKELEL